MLLRFPDAQTLTLTITSGLVAHSIISHQVQVLAESDGSIWIQTDDRLSEKSLHELRTWGVSLEAQSPAELRPVSSWLEAIPLRVFDGWESGVKEQTVVLFELPDAHLLGDLVNELLRLGNDRISFRLLGDDESRTALLRVVGPPYYSLLRAVGLDASGGSRPGSGLRPRAYLESAPRVWVQAGFQHPLTDRIRPAPGLQVLIAADARWRQVRELPFRDIYEVLTFDVPPAQPLPNRQDQSIRLRTPLKLVRGSGVESAELWVLSQAGLAQLEQFVRHSSDELLQRVAFAVAGDAQQPTVLIRVRPGPGSPPVLVFDGLACRSYLRIANLYLPVGLRLHPPLRRDAIRSMLVRGDHDVVWVEPVSEESDGTMGSLTGFVPRSIPDTAFRPLVDWVDYVLDSDHVALTAWRESHQFDFDDFLCPEETDGTKKNVREAQKPSAPEPIRSADQHLPDAPPARRREPRRPRSSKVASQVPEAPARIRELEAKLQLLEQGFLGNDAPLDDAARIADWKEMAELNGSLHRFGDAVICELHTVWETDLHGNQGLVEWLDWEVAGARMQSASMIVDDTGEVSERLLVGSPGTELEFAL